MAPCRSAVEPCSSRSLSGAIAAAGSTLASNRSASVRLRAPGKSQGSLSGVDSPGIVQLIEGLERLGAGRVGLLAIAGQRRQSARRPP